MRATGSAFLPVRYLQSPFPHVPACGRAFCVRSLQSAGTRGRSLILSFERIATNRTHSAFVMLQCDPGFGNRDCGRAGLPARFTVQAWNVFTFRTTSELVIRRFGRSGIVLETFWEQHA
jgi:hypothetical protein